MSVPCDGDVITVLRGTFSLRKTQPLCVMAREHSMGLVLQRWDLTTRQRTIIPVLDEQDSPSTDQDNFLPLLPAIEVGMSTGFVTRRRGRLRGDVTSGNARAPFSILSGEKTHLSDSR